MTGSADAILKWTFAGVYALAGALIGGAFVFVVLKIAFLVAGSHLISAQAIEIVVALVAVATAAVSAAGYLRQR